MDDLLRYAGPVLSTYILAVAALFGLVMGSFLNCWAWRMTHGESILAGRSHCPDCGHTLSARDLIPLGSWLVSRGRCRYCGQPVSARYPLTELVCGAAYAAIVARYGLTLECLEMLCFASILLVLSLTDLDEWIIPNGCILTALAVRAAYIVAVGALGAIDPLELLRDTLIGGFAIGLGLLAVVLAADKVLGVDSMGGGDLKLFFVAGCYFGWQQGLLIIILSCVIGLVLALFGPRPQRQPAVAGADLALLEGEERERALEAIEEARGDNAAGSDSPLKRTIPFGPSIALACFIVMMAGDQAIGWYLSLF